MVGPLRESEDILSGGCNYIAAYLLSRLINY